MEAPETVGTFSLRTVLALGVCSLAGLAGVAALALLPHETKGKTAPRPGSAQGSAQAAEDEAAFFYDAVGRAPRGFEDDVPAAGRERGAKVSYTLEIKVASSREEAERIIDELHEQGVESYYTPLTREGHVVFRVRRGIYASQRDADKAAVAMRKAQAVEAKVVKLQ